MQKDVLIWKGLVQLVAMSSNKNARFYINTMMPIADKLWHAEPLLYDTKMEI